MYGLSVVRNRHAVAAKSFSRLWPIIRDCEIAPSNPIAENPGPGVDPSWYTVSGRMMSEETIDSVLVTGATGYVGGRLVPRLLQAGYDVRVLVRGSAIRLNGRPWKDQVEIVVGDVLAPAETLDAAMQGIDAAYYLVHSMRRYTEFGERDVRAAKNFAAAAAAAGVKNIIYLSGLGDAEDELSTHLRSRQQTGEILRQFDVPVTEFRAGMIVGCGSLSFEMMRDLTERLPVCLLYTSDAADDL